MFSDLNIENVEISFSNKGLWPWEGGCLWEREGEKPLIQLRTVFKTKERFLGIYHRKEILAHEAVHAQRLGYREPIFEEIIAYQTSHSAFRRFWGPLFRNSYEALIFCACSFITFFSWIPLILCVLFFSIRLFYYQWVFSKLKKILTFKYGTLDSAFQYIVLLKDKDILRYINNK